MPRNQQALAELERMVIDNGDNPVPFQNTASCRGNTASAIAYYTKKNSLKPVTKEYSYDDEHSTESQPRYNFTIDINPYRLKMNDGNEMVVEDAYSETLSVDYESISYVTEPPEAASEIHYDYRGNTGTFFIPDETHVIITYGAAVVRKEGSTDKTVSFSNNVSVLGYSAGIKESTEVTASSFGTAENVSLMLFKYCSGHMERGLNGTKFQLLKAVTDDDGKLLYNDDKTPKATPVKDIQNRDVVFTTGTENGNDGYIRIKLTPDDHGQNLETNTTYYLHEIEAPSGFAKDNIYYRFTINKDGTVNYDDYHYLDGDVLKIRNTPESVDFIVTKEIKGNVTLTSADKDHIRFNLQKKNTETNVWEDYIPKGETVSPYSAVSYADFTDSGFTFRSLTQGKYRLIESGNTYVRNAHASSRFSASMLLDDNVGNSVSDTNTTTYDGIQIEFDITQAHLQNADPRTLNVTNTYSVATVDKKVIKRWYDSDGVTEINWPTGLTVQLDIYRYDTATSQTEGNPVQSITLDGVADKNGEFIPGQATFLHFPLQKEVKTNGVTTLVTQIYAVKEVTAFNGYQPENNDPVMVFYDTSTSQSIDSLTFKNVKKTTSFSVKKEWFPVKPENASATFRLFSYTGTDVSKAKMVDDMDLPRAAASASPPLTEAEQWTAVFDNLPLVNDQDVPLNYIAKEINSTPGYEPSYTGSGSYTGNDGIITNKPAKTDFSVTVQWENLSGDE